MCKFCTYHFFIKFRLSQILRQPTVSSSRRTSICVCPSLVPKLSNKSFNFYIPNLAIFFCISKKFEVFHHRICGLPIEERYWLALMKWLLPKKPRYDERGDGCGDVRTQCFVVSMNFDLLMA